MAKCSIILPTLNEEKYLARTLDSLNNQTISLSDCEVLIVDSGSTDKTRDIAKSYSIPVIDAPRGKLTARDIGTRAATSDIIVSVDADCYYPRSWLEKTLDGFKEYYFPYEIVGVTGPRIYETFGTQTLSRMFYSLCWRMFGSNSAYLKKAYYMTGGFDLKVDQQDSEKMVNEEEIFFKERLQSLGIVLYQPENHIITSARRYGFGDTDYTISRKEGERF